MKKANRVLPQFLASGRGCADLGTVSRYSVGIRIVDQSPGRPIFSVRTFCAIHAYVSAASHGGKQRGRKSSCEAKFPARPHGLWLAGARRNRGTHIYSGSVPQIHGSAGTGPRTRWGCVHRPTTECRGVLASRHSPFYPTLSIRSILRTAPVLEAMTGGWAR